MTKFILTLILSLLKILSHSQTITNDELKPLSTITVKVQNLASNKGKVLFGLYNSEENFNQKIAFSGLVGEIKEFKSEVVFQNIPKGTYAIICFRDENENGKMDFDKMMPTEDFGATNNPRVFGPPQFNLSKFDVKDTNLIFEIFF